MHIFINSDYVWLTAAVVFEAWDSWPLSAIVSFVFKDDNNNWDQARQQ